MIPLPQRQRGVALIIVMLIVAIASTAAVAMLSRQQLDLRRTENSLYYGQARLYALGVEYLAKQVLMDDRKKNKTDDLSEDWANPAGLKYSTTEGVQMSGKLTDLQGLYNINALRQKGNALKEAEAQFRRLLKVVGLDPEISDAVVDWLDENQDVHFPSGAEDNYYLGLPQAYRTSGQPMVSTSELLLVKGMTPKGFAALKPFVCALPKLSTLNINTAPAEVLATLADNLPLAQLQALVKKREQSPYTDVQAFLSDRIFAGRQINSKALDVASKYFMLHSETRISHVLYQHTAMLERKAKPKITVRTLMRMEGEL